MTLGTAATIFIICFTPHGAGSEECAPPITTAEIGKAFDEDLRVYRVDVHCKVQPRTATIGRAGTARRRRRVR
jgi:hypothetical protein